MIGHPREETLLAFQDHRLDDRRRRRLAGHLSGCQRCRNVVQAHRTVRGVFAFEAPFAPDGVLERALASRAAGMLVVLPVAEPDAAAPRPALPRRGFVVAAGVVLAMLAGVQLVPSTRLKQLWGAWSGMIAEWQPFGEDEVPRVTYPLPPVAKGAVVEPSRVRAMRARYRSQSLRDGQVSDVDTITVELTKTPRAWRLQTGWADYSQVAALLDTTLEPIEWRVMSRWGSDNQHISNHHYTIRGDSIRGISRPILGPSKVQPRYGRDPYDSTWHYERRYKVPHTLSEAHLFALFSAMPIRRGWVGSMYAVPAPRYWQQVRGIPTTFIATGEDTLTTPAGHFEVWEVSELSIGRRPNQVLWVDKVNGTVVKMSHGGRWGSEYLLESVTYP